MSWKSFGDVVGAIGRAPETERHYRESDGKVWQVTGRARDTAEATVLRRIGFHPSAVGDKWFMYASSEAEAQDILRLVRNAGIRIGGEHGMQFRLCPESP